MARAAAKGPQFVRYFDPVLDALRHLGGSGTPDEVRERVAVELGLADAVLNEPTASGQSRFDNQVAWARFYLAKAGLIDASQRGVWSLTDKGLATRLSSEAALRLFQEVQAQFKGNAEAGGQAANGRQSKAMPVDDDAVVEEATSQPKHREALLQILQTLPPAGFERFCMRLLRESGFQQVEVTGRTGDGGIDGHGILQINPLVSFRVLFQCKRYKDSVTPSQIRDFRGAMMGRAEKGIFLTTGTFTREARKESLRDGAPPLELVDADKLMEMIENLELGVRPIKVFEVEAKFFDEFK